MNANIQRYCQLLDAVMGGAEDYDLLCLRGKSITERNEFEALVQEFKKETLTLRIHQVNGCCPTIVTFFQWALGYADRYPDVAASWIAFVAYSNKNHFKLEFRMDKSLVFMLGLFEEIHYRVVEHRQKQAA